MRFTKIAAVLGAMGLVALAGPAMAAPPYTVAIGGSTATQNAAYTAASQGNGIEFVAHNGANDVEMACTSVTAAGVIHGGTSTSGDIADIASTTWSGCTGPLGLSLAVDQLPVGSGSTPWDIVATGAASSGTSDVVTGYVDGVGVRVTSTNPFIPCTFTVTGSADASFDEAGQDLDVNETSGNLGISGVSGCLGLIANGNTADFVGGFDVTVPAGAVNIQ
jgi:hypothetical protein